MRAFSAAALRAWNSLPHTAQSSLSVPVFKCRLETF
jgi:hypothetical protein